MVDTVSDWERVSDAFARGRDAESSRLASERLDHVATRVLLFDGHPFAVRVDGLPRTAFLPEGLQDPEERTLREIVWHSAESHGLRPTLNSPLLEQVAGYPQSELNGAWYEQLRARWRPERITVLLIGESPPAPGPGAPRFFYAEPLVGADNLYRSVVLAGLRISPGHAGDVKHPHLRALRSRGVYLIDLCREPVNHLSGVERRARRLASAPDCVERVRALDPFGVIVCHKPTFEILQEPLADLLLHNNPLPFPLGNRRAEFIEGAGQAFNRGGVSPWSDDHGPIGGDIPADASEYLSAPELPRTGPSPDYGPDVAPSR